MTASQLAQLEWVGATLLLVPAIFSFLKLCVARFYEHEAKSITDPARRQMEADDARQMASTASLFPFWVMLMLGAGLAAQLCVLIAKVGIVAP